MPLDLFAAKRLSDQTQNGDICRHFGRTFTPREKSKIFPAGTPAFLALRAEALTALRHSGRAFTAHVAESAGVSKGLCPLTFSPPSVHLGSRLR